jgi:hypothetical protein
VSDVTGCRKTQVSGVGLDRFHCNDKNRERERVMVLIATFNNILAISWRSVLLAEETGEFGENHRPVADH